MNPKKKNNSSSSLDKSRSKAIDYSEDPFFVKKHEDAQKFIDKYGIPKELLENKKAK